MLIQPTTTGHMSYAEIVVQSENSTELDNNGIGNEAIHFVAPDNYAIETEFRMTGEMAELINLIAKLKGKENPTKDDILKAIDEFNKMSEVSIYLEDGHNLTVIDWEKQRKLMDELINHPEKGIGENSK